MKHARSRLAAVAVVVWGALGCGGGSSSEQLVGHWTLDAEATRSLPQVQAMSEEQRAGLYRNLAAMTVDVTFTTGTVRKEVALLEGATLVEKGSYRLVHRTGNSMVLALTTEGGERKRMGVSVDGDLLVLEMDESCLALKRE